MVEFLSNSSVQFIRVFFVRGNGVKQYGIRVDYYWAPFCESSKFHNELLNETIPNFIFVSDGSKGN